MISCADVHTGSGEGLVLAGSCASGCCVQDYICGAVNVRDVDMQALLQLRSRGKRKIAA